MITSKKHWFPYIGETLEFVGILALTMGLFFIIAGLFQESLLLRVVYSASLLSLLGIVGYELYLNRRELNASRDRGGQTGEVGAETTGALRRDSDHESGDRAGKREEKGEDKDLQ